jgi:signal transduction histidine kinase
MDEKFLPFFHLSPREDFLVPRLEDMGYQEKRDDEITRRLLLARSLMAGGQHAMAYREFMNIAERFPQREEAVLANLAAFEAAITMKNRERELKALRCFLDLMALKNVSGLLRDFLLERLNRFEDHLSGEGLRALLDELKQKVKVSGKEGLLKGGILTKKRHELLEGFQKGLSIFQIGEDLLFLKADRKHEKVAVASVSRSRYFQILQDYWKKNPGRFLLSLSFSRPSSENFIGLNEIKLGATGVYLRVALDPLDQSTQLLKEQMRLGLMGTLLLLLLLVFGIFLAVLAIVQAQKTSRLKTDFVSTVSHELRTPLTAIQIFVETLREGRVKDRKEEMHFLSIIDRETRRLKYLIERLLSFSALEKGRMPLRKTPVALDRICRHCADLLKPEFQEKGLNLVLKVPDREVEVWGESNALIEIILNLLSNALKYALQGESVELSLHQEKELVVLSVKDQGPGFPLEKKEKLFEAFVRGDKENCEDDRGTGLGLAIVRRYVDWHEARLEVSNPPEGGALFEVFFPCYHEKKDVRNET